MHERLRRHGILERQASCKALLIEEAFNGPPSNIFLQQAVGLVILDDYVIIFQGNCLDRPGHLWISVSYDVFQADNDGCGVLPLHLPFRLEVLSGPFFQGAKNPLIMLCMFRIESALFQVVDEISAFPAACGQYGKASGVKPASCRRVSPVGGVALSRNLASSSSGVWYRYRLKQSLCVWMFGIREDVLAWPDLHDSP